MNLSPSRLKLSKIVRRLKKIFQPNPDRFLKHVSGVIHVGANLGQERDIYNSRGLRVIWIEPIPEIYQKLHANLLNYPNQVAFQYLITDRDDSKYKFHIANNEGASSSILEMKQHKDIWPEVTYEDTIELQSITLTSLTIREKIDLTRFQALVLDTQGSELLILKGAEPILDRFVFLKIEVSNFESYQGCCQLRDIEPFLKSKGFDELYRNEVTKTNFGGSYYEIVYRRQDP